MIRLLPLLVLCSTSLVANGQTDLFSKIPSVGEWAEYEIKTYTVADGEEIPFIIVGKLIMKIVAPPSKPKEKWIEIHLQIGSELYSMDYDVLKIPQPNGLPFGFKSVAKAKKAWLAHESVGGKKVPTVYSPRDPLKVGESLENMPNHLPVFVFPNVTFVHSGNKKTIDTPFGKLKCKQLNGNWKLKGNRGKINSLVFTNEKSPFGLVEAVHTQTITRSSEEQTLKYRFTLRKTGKDAKSLFSSKW